VDHQFWSPEVLSMRQVNPVEIRICRADIQHRSELLRLLEQHYRDLSEFTPWLFRIHEPFDYPALPSYWTEPDRHPFLFRVAERLAGFALVQQRSHLSGSPGINDIAEFFVLREYRRRGIGRSAAHAVFQAFPGTWEVRVRECNTIGLSFWENTVETFTQSGARELRHEEDSSIWRVFVFESPPLL